MWTLFVQPLGVHISEVLLYFFQWVYNDNIRLLNKRERKNYPTEAVRDHSLCPGGGGAKKTEETNIFVV